MTYLTYLTYNQQRLLIAKMGRRCCKLINAFYYLRFVDVVLRVVVLRLREAVVVLRAVVVGL